MNGATTIEVDDEQTVGRRASPRLDCDMVVEVQAADGDWNRVLLWDISACGFMLVTPQASQAGDVLSLRISGYGPFRAEVRWRTAGALGCRFFDRLDCVTEQRVREIVSQAPRLAAPPMAKCVDAYWRHP